MRIDTIPIPLLFVGTVVGVLLIIEFGHRLGNVVRKRSPDEKESSVSAIAGSILGLSAFILAFTFGIVTDRYETRKGLVREDANAIRTAWRRSDFLPEPDRTEAKGLFKHYLDARLAFAKAGTLDPASVKAAMADARQVQDRLWEVAVVNARKDMNSDVAALYIESLNDMANVHALRVAVGVQSRIPIEIWLALFFLTGLGMAGMGYQIAIADSRRSVIQLVLAVAFSVVVVLIASLDRPDSGILRVNQLPLMELQDAMAAAASR